MQVQEWIREMQRAVEIARTIDPPTLDGEPLQLWQIEAQRGEGEHVFLDLDEDLDRELRAQLTLEAIPWKVYAQLVDWTKEIQQALERAGISPQVILALWEWRFVVPTREEVAQADDEVLSKAMEAAEAAARALGAEAVRFSPWRAGVEFWDIEGWLLPPVDLLPLHAANAAATVALREALQSAREKPEFRKALLEWCRGKD